VIPKIRIISDTISQLTNKRYICAISRLVDNAGTFI